MFTCSWFNFCYCHLVTEISGWLHHSNFQWHRYPWFLVYFLGKINNSPLCEWNFLCKFRDINKVGVPNQEWRLRGTCYSSFDALLYFDLAHLAINFLSSGFFLFFYLIKHLFHPGYFTYNPTSTSCEFLVSCPLLFCFIRGFVFVIRRLV